MYYIKTVPAQVTDAMEKLQGALPESLAVVAAREHSEEPMPKNLSGNGAMECRGILFR